MSDKPSPVVFFTDENDAGPALERAMEYAKEHGGEVFVAPGTYNGSPSPSWYEHPAVVSAGVALVVSLLVCIVWQLLVR